MNWGWWIIAFVAGFILEACVIGSNGFHAAGVALFGRLLTGGLLFGALISVVLSVGFLFARKIR